MPEPIKTIAKHLGITRQGVQARMDSIPNFKTKYTYKDKNRLIIDNKGIKLLKDKPRKYKKNNNLHHKNLLLHTIINDSKKKSILINRLTIMLNEQVKINATQSKQLKKLTYKNKHHNWFWHIFH